MEFWLYLVVIFQLCNVISSSCYFYAVSKLGSYDSLLSGRLAIKKKLIRDGISKERYILTMTNFTSNGTKFSSDGSSDWMSEMLHGLEGSYEEERKLYNSGATAAGYMDITNTASSFFRRHLASNKHLFFKVRLSGVFEHDWIIEQRQSNQGYRVYQGVGDAYSIQAWMNTDVSNFKHKLWNDGQIIYWRNLHDKVKQFLGKDRFTNVEKEPTFLRPWLYFIKAYNQTLITHNLRRAWVHYGGGKVAPVNQFQNDYIKKLRNITLEVKLLLLNRGHNWTRGVDNNWIDLFGSPNPWCYPGTPFQTYTEKRPRFIKIEAKVIEPPSATTASKNAAILAKSVFRDEVDISRCSKGVLVESHMMVVSIVTLLLIFYYSWFN